VGLKASPFDGKTNEFDTAGDVELGACAIPDSLGEAGTAGVGAGADCSFASAKRCWTTGSVGVFATSVTGTLGTDLTSVEFGWAEFCADFAGPGVEDIAFVIVATISRFGSGVSVTFVAWAGGSVDFATAAFSTTEVTVFSWGRAGGSRLIESLLSLPVSFETWEPTDFVDLLRNALISLSLITSDSCLEDTAAWVATLVAGDEAATFTGSTFCGSSLEFVIVTDSARFGTPTTEEL
jgi:hypothetical protein